MAFVEIILGLVLLTAGGEWLVRGAVDLARRIGVSPLLIGLTIVGFGTSVPELVTSVQAALTGAPAIAIGNVVGSNIANILLILGIAAVVAPIACARHCLRRDGSAMLLAAGAMLAVGVFGFLGRPHGLVLLAGLLAYIFVAWRSDRMNLAVAGGVVGSPEAPCPTGAAGGVSAAVSMQRTSALTAGLVLIGLGMVIFGAQVLVEGAIALAATTGLAETVIGLTVVAVGTSLPELATSFVAAIRRQPEIALGNIIGSNIFNVLGIAGATAVIQPIVIPVQIMAFDIWVMLAASAALMVFGWTGGRLSRPEGVGFLAAYVLYLYTLFA